MLYLVPTPIGNLEDMTFRAVKVLQEVELVLAEDTRTSRKLFQHYGIETPMRAFHTHNEHGVLPGIMDKLRQGAQIALVSDAGTPGISDPGFLLVRECKREKIAVQCLPGPTAFLPALVASGIPCDSFHYEGFLPHKKGRQTRLKYLSALPHTFVLYESPHRLLKCLQQLIEHCGPERTACVARELSKIHEEVKTDSLKDLHSYFSEKGVKGEIVVVVAGN
jgi:16S rRNA (cytidine1402-2'-O)-methyltransferase